METDTLNSKALKKQARRENMLNTNRPWSWVPTTYFMEGMPFTMIVIVSTIMYKNFGLSNAHITYYTGVLYLPWIVKPIWAWFVDIFKTKRWWIYTMEMCVAVAFVFVVFSLHSPNFFKLTICVFWVMAFLSSSHDIATDGFYLIGLNSAQQSFFVGMQSIFYQVAKLLGSGLLVVLAGVIIKNTHNLVLAWSTVFIIIAIICAIVSIYHKAAIPKIEAVQTKTIREGAREIVTCIVEFFKLPRIWVAILFVCFFRLGENEVAKIIPLFILDPRSSGGLGFSDQFIGFSNMFTLISIIIAGLLGGIYIYKVGLKSCIWYMLLFVNVPHIIYIYLAYAQPHNAYYVIALQCIENFAVTFSLTAYTLFTFYSVKESKYKTAHYAFLAGIMVAAVMVPSMFSGQLQQMMGYKHFFIFVMFTMIPSLLLLPFIKVDPNFGRRIKDQKLPK